MSTQDDVREEQVSWKVDDIDVQATLTRPAGNGPFPAIVMVAGSGPTDRNWNSPLIPGTNGSAALLAQVLTTQNSITLRYDKRPSGPARSSEYAAPDGQNQHAGPSGRISRWCAFAGLKARGRSETSLRPDQQ